MQKVTEQSRWRKWGYYWSRGVTLAILVNLALALFNLTYIPLRGLYLEYLPPLVQQYDPIKGIEPHGVTQDYLDTITHLRGQVKQFGLTAEPTQQGLADLRQQSITLIEENPFLASGQVNLFAKLKRRIREFTGATSAQAALQQFWQADYLVQVGWPQANGFLQRQIDPLLQRNYFRETLPTGQFVDNFWRIDIFFMVFFGTELVARSWVVSRYRKDVTWADALVRRWYEFPLVLPFWRWLRLLPAAVRLHRSGLCNVERLISQATHEPAAYLSDRVSKYVLVRLVNQTQESVQTGTLFSNWQPATHTPVGAPQKLDQITDRLVQVIVLKVMPTIKPDLEELLRHSLQGALTRSEFYDGLRQIPGFGTVPSDALNLLSDYLAQATCDVLAESYTDNEGRVLLDQLSRDFRHTLGQELQSGATSTELQQLLSDLLEELKVNYIQKSQQTDPASTLDEVENLKQVTR